MGKPFKRFGESTEDYTKRSCRKLFNDGHSVFEISNIMGLAHTEVFNALHDDMKYITKEQQQNMVSDHKSGISIREISKKYNISKCSARKHVNGKPFYYDELDDGLVLSSSDLKKIIKMYSKDHRTIAEIAKQFNISKHQVVYRLQKAGVYVKTYTKITDSEKEYFNSLYKHGLTITKIAKIVGRPRQTISKYIDKN